MKKIIQKFALLIVMSAVILPVGVMAIDLGGGLLGDAQKAAGFKQATETTLAENVGYIINVALSFVGIIFTVLMVYAGYLWMTAAGETAQIDKAKKIITACIIGLVITLSAYSISNFVVSRIVAKVSNK